jgi:secreted trypsin-like serine protease
MGFKKNWAFGIIGVAALGAGACATDVGDSAREDLGEARQQIVGGSHVTPGRYPWMVEISLRRTGADGKDIYDQWCGGALIAKRWVLTAAHCLKVRESPTGETMKKGDLRIHLGEHDREAADGEIEALIADDLDIMPHPNYNTLKDPVADIGLIKLAQDAPLSDRIKILRVTKGTDYVNNASYAGVATWLSGWGDMYPKLVEGLPTQEPTLKELFGYGVAPNAPQSNILDSLSCTDYMASDTFNPGGFDTRSDAFCTLHPDTTRAQPGSPLPNFQSACFGDSGSPRIRQTADGCFEEIGVHVTGDSYCWAYDMATSIAPYLPWIHSKVDSTYEAEIMTHQTGGAHPEGWNVWDNGYISFNHQSIGGQQQMTVRAAGQNGNGWPHLRVTVNGTDVYNVDVTQTAWKDYTFPFTAAAGNINVRLYLTNDLYVSNANPPVDRNLFIDKVSINDLSNNATCQRGPSATDVSTTLAVTSAWQDGYCAELRMNNSSSSTVPTWHAQVDLKTSTFNNGWGLSGSGTGLQTFTGLDWGKTIDPHSTRVVGFCARRPLSSGVVPALVSFSPF